jgi:hypothetical protein
LCFFFSFLLHSKHLTIVSIFLFAFFRFLYQFIGDPLLKLCFGMAYLGLDKHLAAVGRTVVCRSGNY